MIPVYSNCYPFPFGISFSPQTSAEAEIQSFALLSEPSVEPIWIAPKFKCQKQVHNIFLDDRGFPDQSEEYNYLLHNVDGHPILCKLLHPSPAIDGKVDPLFLSVFDLAVQETQMQEDLDLSHLSLEVQDQVYGLICQFWSVFDSKGMTVPIKNYECIIDTGTAPPIAVKKILYNEHESAIM